MSYIIFVTFLQVTVLHNIISLYLKVQYMLKARLVNKIGYKSLFHMSSWLFQWEREAGFLEDWIKQIIPIVNLPLRLRILTVAKASTPPIFYCLLMPVLFVLSNCLSHFFSFYDCNCWLKLGNRIFNWAHKIRKTQHNENKISVGTTCWPLHAVDLPKLQDTSAREDRPPHDLWANEAVSIKLYTTYFAKAYVFAFF